MKEVTAKKETCEMVYHTMIDVAFFHHPFDKIRKHIDDRFMAYGTALDEKLKGWEGYEWMVLRQREEMADENYEIKRNPIHQIFSNEDNHALIVEEFEFHFVTAEGPHSFLARLSTTLEFNHDKWIVLHFHGSTPDADTPDGNAWPIEEWKRRNAELESIVKEKTAELIARNRDLEVEAGLERVRARSMAMQNSEELPEVAHLLYEQIKLLGIKVWSAAFNIFQENKKAVKCNVSSEGLKQPSFRLPLTEEKSFLELYASMQRGENFFVQELAEDDLKHHYEYLFALPGVKEAAEPLEEAGINLPAYQINHYCRFEYGYLMFITYEKVPEVHSIFKRFTHVFEQTYTRFLDLQKAETQAREAKIEASLERVRVKGMAMQSTGDIESATAVVFNELSRLGIDMDRCGITLMNETPFAEIWSTSLSPDNKEVIDIVTGHLDFRMHPLTQRTLNDWKAKKEMSLYILRGKELKEYYSRLENQPNYKFPKVDEYPEKQILYTFFFHGGAVFVYSKVEFSEEANKIVKRFTKVFEQTYTRFLDLQKAEAQAREAQIETALERVRARATAMRKSDELSEAAELLYNEFLKFGVESFSCGYLINDDEKKEWKVWLTNPGDPFFKEYWTVPFDADQHLEVRYQSWINQENFHCAVLEGEVNIEHHKIITQYAPWKAEILDTLPKKLVFNSANFTLGHLLVISPERLGSELEDLMIRFASVFDLAYRRFLDLENTEKQARLIKEERDRLNITLKDLRETQSQLIHSEKMASLGELTAGIAHEIQNPLNFVNNFSEINKELLEEAQEEIDDGNIEEVKAIIQDLIDNEKKINEHGKRADTIVKGMLMHSRKSTGEKANININALCEEYIRLAYHGMRAKTRNFNAEFETDLDPDLPNVKVVPQDIGRVLLNIINNAFQALTDLPDRQRTDRSINAAMDGQKFDGQTSDFHSASEPLKGVINPKVVITTKKLSDSIEITISDNGPGIPEDVQDKIFQPFYTTKPTGEGTGLGLSLSYDIVDAHGGKIKLISEVGKGSTFIINLPLLSQ